MWEWVGRGEVGDSRTERGGSQFVCEERWFLNASFIQERSIYTRALALCCYCAGSSCKTVQRGTPAALFPFHAFPNRAPRWTRILQQSRTEVMALVSQKDRIVWPTVDTTAHLSLQHLFCSLVVLVELCEEILNKLQLFVLSLSTQGFYWLQLLTIVWLLLATSWIILCKYVYVHTFPMCSKHTYRESRSKRMYDSWMQIY